MIDMSWYIKENVSNNKNIFYDITSLNGLFSAWDEFRKGKENKLDVQKFFLDLENQIFDLWRNIKNGTYCHSNYESFFVCDPKLRHINKAAVIDRVLHHSIVGNIEPLFEKSFIFDSYSSRTGKGTHRAVKRLRNFFLKISRNNTRTVWALKCDIKKFFDSIDHDILLNLVREKIKDGDTLSIIEKVVRSYNGMTRKGVPLGNLTSQLFSNVYLNKLDHFVKRTLGIKYYVRYADDFVILDCDKQKLENLVSKFDDFVYGNFKLRIHPNKIVIKKLNQGIDFLGYVVFPTHIILRTKTKRRMLKKIKKRKLELETGLINQHAFNQCLQSYFGMLKHCRGNGIRKEIGKIMAD